MAFAPELEAGRRRNIEDLLRLLEQISSTSEVEVARKRFDAFSRRLGFCSCACLSVPSQPQEPLTVIEVSRQNNAFWAEYREQRLYTSDPVLARAARSNVCLTWSEIERSIHPGADEQRVFDCARQYGMSDGISVPIHQTGDGFALVSLIGSPATMNQSVRLVVHLGRDGCPYAIQRPFPRRNNARPCSDEETDRDCRLVGGRKIGLGNQSNLGGFPENSELPRRKHQTQVWRGNPYSGHRRCHARRFTVARLAGWAERVRPISSLSQSAQPR